MCIVASLHGECKRSSHRNSPKQTSWRNLWYNAVVTKDNNLKVKYKYIYIYGKVSTETKLPILQGFQPDAVCFLCHDEALWNCPLRGCSDPKILSHRASQASNIPWFREHVKSKSLCPREEIGNDARISSRMFWPWLLYAFSKDTNREAKRDTEEHIPISLCFYLLVSCSGGRPNSTR